MDMIHERLKIQIQLADDEMAGVTRHVGQWVKTRIADSSIPYADESDRLRRTEMLLTGELSIAASLKRLMDVHRDLFNLAKESLVLGVSYPYYQIAQRIHKAMDLVEMPDTKSHSYRTGFQHESPVHPQLITDGFRYLDSLWQLIMEDVKALRNSELLEWLAESPTAEFLRKSREAMNAGDLVTIEDMLAEHR